MFSGAVVSPAKHELKEVLAPNVEPPSPFDRFLPSRFVESHFESPVYPVQTPVSRSSTMPQKVFSASRRRCICVAQQY